MREATILLGAALWLCTAGCPGPGPQKPVVAALDEASLPSEPDKLVQLSDDQLEKGGDGTKNALLALHRALDKNPDWANRKESFAAHFRIARAEAELCERDGTKKLQHAEAGINAGRKALSLEPDRVEGNYYLAQVLGYSVQDRKGESKELVAEIVRLAERAIQLDEKFDHAGPPRLLGALYAKAPAPPLSIGDPEKAVKLLERAVELAADHPANQIYLADALVADERYREVDEVLKRAKGLLADPRWARHRDGWSAELGRVERKLRAKQ